MIIRGIMRFGRIGSFTSVKEGLLVRTSLLLTIPATGLDSATLAYEGLGQWSRPTARTFGTMYQRSIQRNHDLPASRHLAARPAASMITGPVRQGRDHGTRQDRPRPFFLGVPNRTGNPLEIMTDNMAPTSCLMAWPTRPQGGQQQACRRQGSPFFFTT